MTHQALYETFFIDSMEIIVNVLDQNDNRPVFTQNPFNGNVLEASVIGRCMMQFLNEMIFSSFIFFKCLFSFSSESVFILLSLKVMSL